MKRINQRQAVEAIRNKEEFKAGALSARWECEYRDYVVMSYNTIIAMCADGEWKFNSRKYSATTSRHQSIVRRAIGE